MQDLGGPVAYTGIADGTPVFDRNGKRIGVVEHVMADLKLDIFHGLIIHTTPLPGRHTYADADQVADMYERGVVLSVGRDKLHEPIEKSRQVARQSEETPLEARIRRAWDWIAARR